MQLFNAAWKSRSSPAMRDLRWAKPVPHCGSQSSMALPVNDSTGIMEWWNRWTMGCEGIL